MSLLVEEELTNDNMVGMMNNNQPSHNNMIMSNANQPPSQSQSSSNSDHVRMRKRD